jgi:hypothetical protein
MKTLIILATFVITITSCNCQKKIVDATEGRQNEKSEIVALEQKETIMQVNQGLPLIEYESNSRGFFKKITIDNGRIYVQTAREAKPAFWELKKTDLSAIETAYRTVDVVKLSSLKAPTEKRFYDGAPITNLRITKNKEVYQTTDFDGGFPPKEIENLVNVLLDVAEKLNK